MTNIESSVQLLVQEKCENTNFDNFNIAVIMTTNLKEINDLLIDNSEIYLITI